MKSVVAPGQGDTAGELRLNERSSWWVLAVFSAGIGLRLLLTIAYRPAFLGDPDSANYVGAASGRLFSDPVHPAGYALFLRVLHSLFDRLDVVPFAQHALGVATALMLYLLGRRAGSRAAGLLAAAVILFSGPQLWLEHSVLSDSLFTFLVTATIFLAVFARHQKGGILAVGVSMCAASVVRSAGLTLVPVVVIWLACMTPGRLRRRFFYSAVPAIVALGLLSAYVAFQHHRTGITGLIPAGGRVVYAIAAPFANCKAFTPPPGTRRLCQPPGRRGHFNQYLWGVPETAAMGDPSPNRALFSPAWRAFGPMPNGDTKLGAFGRSAILHQPAAYLKQTLVNFLVLAVPDDHTLTGAAEPDPPAAAAVAAYYGVRTVGKPGTSYNVLLDLGRVLEPGVFLWVLLLGSLLTAAIAPGEERAIGVLAAAVGWLVLAGTAAVATDPRYATPAIGPLTLAAAIAVSAIRNQGFNPRAAGRLIRRRSRDGPPQG